MHLVGIFQFASDEGIKLGYITVFDVLTVVQGYGNNQIFFDAVGYKVIVGKVEQQEAFPASLISRYPFCRFLSAIAFQGFSPERTLRVDVIPWAVWSRKKGYIRRQSLIAP
jgi:hypothetical protein